MSVFCAAAAGGHVAFFQGDYHRVVDSLQPLFDHDVVSAPEEPGVHPWRHIHAEALIRLDRLSEASDAVGALEALAACGQRRSAAAHAVMVRALLDVKAGDADAARDRFETALGAVIELNTPFERARVHEAYGRFLRRAGERRAASTHLAAAMETFETLGARPLVQQCQAELAACGQVTKPRRGAPAPELTAQQLAVARLVAKGLANKEIAAEMVVSVKTVDYHLGQLYARLGVHTRTQLMARLAEN
jgi:DNA-binding NarL/FixJ family response regulator